MEISIFTMSIDLSLAGLTNSEAFFRTTESKTFRERHNDDKRHKRVKNVFLRVSASLPVAWKQAEWAHESYGKAHYLRRLLIWLAIFRWKLFNQKNIYAEIK
jgi:hypothetical protein